MKFISRLGALLAFALNRPFKVRLHRGDAWFYPAQSLVLPVIAGADGEEEKKEEEEAAAAKKAEEEKAAEATEEEKEAEEKKAEEKQKEPDWKAESRKHERRSKKEKEAREEAEKKLQERDDADKTEQQKAVDKAREEGKTEALTTAEKERRKDRLESAVTRAAGKKIKIGEGEDAKEVRFEDPEDAEIYLNRKIAKGDLDEDDLYDSDGKVKTDVVAEALKEIIEEKPRLAEDGGVGEEKLKTAKGGADQRKGGGSGGDKDLEEMSPEEHEKRKAKE